MANKLEQLLNSLIEKGWKPRNKEEVKRLNYHTMYREVVSLEFENYNLGVSYSIRDLVSKESMLWQFVCENKLYKDYNEDSGTYWDSTMKIYNYRDYQYWVIESSLKDESELESFILDNIKIDVESK